MKIIVIRTQTHPPTNGWWARFLCWLLGHRLIGGQCVVVQRCVRCGARFLLD